MTEKILVVDDDEFMRDVLQAMLEAAGYAVNHAADGIAALDMIESSAVTFDLILLDRQMPRMDGIELLRQMKSAERLRDIPVILLTGASNQQDVADGLAAGAYYYLVKPAPEEMLTKVIRNALDSEADQRQLREMAGHRKNTLQLLRRAEFSYRSLDEAKELALWLAEASGDSARTVNGFAELLINAVEHGNLGISYAEKGRLLEEDGWVREVERRLGHPDYADRRVSVVMERVGQACRVTIADQGAGFDWQGYLHFSPERAFDLHGRGIAMSKMMSFDSLQYQGNGNTVVVSVGDGRS